MCMYIHAYFVPRLIQQVKKWISAYCALFQGVLPDNWRTLTETGSALTSRAKVFGITSWLSLRSSSTRATKSSRPCASMNCTPVDRIFSFFSVRQPLKAPDLIVLSLLKLRSSSRMWWKPEKASGWIEAIRLVLKSTTSACWRPLRVRLDSRDSLLFRTSKKRTWKKNCHASIWKFIFIVKVVNNRYPLLEIIENNLIFILTRL